MPCTTHLRKCAFASLVKEVRANANPDHEAEHLADFIEQMDAFYDAGDHFGDYDGPLTSVDTNSVCF